MSQQGTKLYYYNASLCIITVVQIKAVILIKVMENTIIIICSLKRARWRNGYAFIITSRVNNIYCTSIL